MVPLLITKGGPVMWLLLAASAAALGLFLERFLLYHREQINASEFLTGVKNVLKRDNVVEALSICDATPGPVSRLVKGAILNREKGRDSIKEGLQEAGMLEVPRLEEKLNLLATIGQIAPLMGFLGTVLGFIKMFRHIQEQGLYAASADLSAGIWQGLVCTAVGLTLAIVAHAAYNYLVSRVGSIVLDMERSSLEILSLLTDARKLPSENSNGGQPPPAA